MREESVLTFDKNTYSYIDKYKPDFDIVWGEVIGNEIRYSEMPSHGNFILRKYNGNKKYIKIPDRILDIGCGKPVFGEVSPGTTIELNNSAKRIHENAFRECKGNIKISRNVIFIQENAFRDCQGYITFEREHREGFNIGQYAFAGCKKIKELPYDLGFRAVATGAFMDCTGIEEIPDSLDRVDELVFSGCINVKKLPSKLRNVGKRAFEGCINITTIPQGIETIGEQAFLNCTNLREITVGKNIEKIASNAFEGCPLERINIQLDTEMLPHDLYHCNNLKHYYINGTLPIKKIVNGVNFYRKNKNWIKAIDLGKEEDSIVLRNLILGLPNENLKDAFWGRFELETFKGNLSTLRKIGIKDEEITTFIINNPILMNHDMSIIIDNFNYIATQKIIPLEDLKQLFFEDSTIVFETKTKEEQKEILINCLKNYYSQKGKLPELLWRLAFEPTDKNRLELRDNIQHISGQELFKDLDEIKKQKIKIMLNRTTFENIAISDLENFKKEIKTKNPYIDYTGAYGEYFKGIKTQFYRKLTGINENYFYDFIESMKNVNELGPLNQFMKSMETIKRWKELGEVERATLLKNEIIAKILYASIDMVYQSGTTLPEDKISKYAKLKEKFQELDFNEVLKNATNIKMDNPMIIELMLEIDPYSFDVFKFDSEMSAKYCVTARKNGYLFTEEELTLQKQNITNIQKGLKDYIKEYYLREKSGTPHTKEEEEKLEKAKETSSILGKNLNILSGIYNYSDNHIFEYLNNIVGISNLAQEENQMYLNQMQIALRKYLNKDTQNINGFLRMLDFYIRANSENILQYNKKDAIIETAKKVFDVYSENTTTSKDEIKDSDRLLYSLYNLNKLAHSINEKHLRIDLIDKRLIDTEEEYRNLTKTIKAINELMLRGMSLEEIFEFVGVEKNSTNQIQRRVSNRSEIGNATKLEEILKNGFAVIRNKYNNWKLVNYLKENVSEERREEIRYKDGEIISKNLKILLDLKAQGMLTGKNKEKIELLASQRQLFFQTKQIIAEELMQRTIKELNVDDFISMTEEQKYEFYKKNGYIVEVQRQPIRNENQEIIGYQPLLACYSKAFNESFSVHLVGLTKEVEEKVNRYINSDQYHAIISHSILVNPGLTLSKENTPIVIDKVKPEQLIKTGGFATSGVNNEYLPSLYNYLKFDCHDALKANPNPTNEDIKRLLDGKFVLPSKLDLTSYVSDIQKNKPENKNKKSIFVPEPIVTVLKKLHLDFGKIKTEETTGKRR